MIVIVDLQQVHKETLIRSSTFALETLLGYRTQRRTRNVAISLYFVGGG